MIGSYENVMISETYENAVGIFTLVMINIIIHQKETWKWKQYRELS